VARWIDGTPIRLVKPLDLGNERRGLVRIVGGLEPTHGVAPCRKGSDL